LFGGLRVVLLFADNILIVPTFPFAFATVFFAVVFFVVFAMIIFSLS
jgi:hypothetical protein